MKESNNEQIKRIDFENWLVWIFIIAGMLNIYANRLRQEFLKTNDLSKEEQAHEIYVFIITVSIFAYFYFVNRNYNTYKESNNDELNKNRLNFVGSVFLFTGAILILLAELNNNVDETPPIF